MIARLTTFKIRPEHLAAVTSQLDAIKSMLSAVDTMVLNFAMWTDEGDGHTLAVYRTLEEAEEAMKTAGKVWENLAPYLDGPVDIKTFENAVDMRG